MRGIGILVGVQEKPMPRMNAAFKHLLTLVLTLPHVSLHVHPLS